MHEIHPSLLQRKIIHVDMDAFFAAVEMRDNPSLQGKVVVVGGSPASRSVVCTANYEARKYGIRSAMSCAQAARLCPTAVFLPPRFEAYQEVSEQIRQIFESYTPLVEPMSLDEAYLDVTECKVFASQIAKKIQQQILEKTQLSCSVGVAPNKLVAKIASDMRKPGGITIVIPEKVKQFMENLPLRKLMGVGPVTERKLAECGFFLCKDLWEIKHNKLTEAVGSWSEWLWEAAQGIDTRAIETKWERKSLGREETLPKDLVNLGNIAEIIKKLSEDISQTLKEKSLKGKTVVLKIKYANFKQITRSLSLLNFTDIAEDIASAAMINLNKTEAGQKPIRLIGVTVSRLVKNLSE